MLSVSVTPIELPLVHPFKIARGEETDRAYRDRSRARRRSRRHRRSDADRTLRRIGRKRRRHTSTSHPLAADDPYRLEALLHAGIPAAARAGLDLALHDLIGKELGKPLYALLGLDPSATPVTSFTIGIADPETTLRKVAEAGDHPILKIKLGSGHAGANRSKRSRRSARATRGTIRIDANEGWDVETADADSPRTRALRDRVLRAADSGGTSGAAARHSRARLDSDRRRRGRARRKRPSAPERLRRRRRTSSWRRPAAFAARSR